MDSMYIKALETRAKWLRWAKENANNYHTPEMRSYNQSLESGDTFFMNKKFCSLVEAARETIPDDLIFDAEWMQAKNGWLWVETPYSVPTELVDEEVQMDRLIEELNLTRRKNEIKEKAQLIATPIKISAVGWSAVPEGVSIGKGKKDELFRVTGPGAFHFMCFQADSKYIGRKEGFNTWSYFTLQNGDKLIDRIRAFEKFALEDGGGYVPSRVTDMMHEIRWVYAAFYLMAQRLAVNVHHNTDRATRRRGERDRLPVTPFIRVVTLRRLEEERKKAEAQGNIEYTCQWEVRGHWRNQYFPSKEMHQPVWIEAYIKGPEDAPFKSPSHRLFVAQR